MQCACTAAWRPRAMRREKLQLRYPSEGWPSRCHGTRCPRARRTSCPAAQTLSGTTLCRGLTRWTSRRRRRRTCRRRHEFAADARRARLHMPVLGVLSAQTIAHIPRANCALPRAGATPQGCAGRDTASAAGRCGARCVWFHCDSCHHPQLGAELKPCASACAVACPLAPRACGAGCGRRAPLICPYLHPLSLLLQVSGRPTLLSGSGAGSPNSGTAAGADAAAAAPVPAQKQPVQSSTAAALAAANAAKKKGCSSNYRGVRQRPWGRCRITLLCPIFFCALTWSYSHIFYSPQ